MKRLLAGLLIFLAIPGMSQTTTFNEGWFTKGVELLCSGSTTVVFSNRTNGLGVNGVLTKYKKQGNEYVKVNSLVLPEALIEHRFAATKKLHLIALNADQCDISDSTNFWVYDIDTNNFSITSSVKLNTIGAYNTVAFVSDNTLAVSDNSETKVYNFKTQQLSNQSLTTSSYTGDYLTSVFTGQFLLSYVKSAGVLILESLNGVDYASNGGVTQKPSTVYSYGSDSLILVGSSLAYKTNTALNNTVTIPLPFYTDSKIVNNHLYLFTDKLSYKYSLPSLNLVATDSLKGLSSKFKLAAINPNPNSLSALAIAENFSAPYEMLLKADITSSNETNRSELRISNSKPIDTVYNGAELPNYEITYLLTLHNDGTDTIRRFTLLYSDFLKIGSCSEKKSKEVNLNIAPGDSITLQQVIRMERDGSVCFQVGAPNQNLENDLLNNESCSYFQLEIADFHLIESLKLYPNPTNGILTLSGEIKDLSNVQFYNTTGHPVKVSSHQKTKNELTYNLSNLPQGVYFVKMKVGGQRLTKKVLKY